MASSITIQLDLQDWPKPPTIGVVGRVGQTTTTVRLVELHEPISTAAMANAVRSIVRAWIEPELFSDGDEQLEHVLDALGKPLL